MGNSGMFKESVGQSKQKGGFFFFTVRNNRCALECVSSRFHAQVNCVTDSLVHTGEGVWGRFLGPIKSLQGTCNCSN